MSNVSGNAPILDRTSTSGVNSSTQVDTTAKINNESVQVKDPTDAPKRAGGVRAKLGALVEFLAKPLYKIADLMSNHLEKDRLAFAERLDNYNANRFQKKADALIEKGTKEGTFKDADYKWDKLNTSLAQAKQQGPVGMRVFAHQFIKTVGGIDPSKPIDLSNAKDAVKAAETLKREMIGSALKFSPDGSINGALAFLKSIDDGLAIAGKANEKSGALANMRILVADSMEILSDPKARRDFALDTARDCHSSFGNTEKVFLRSNNAATKIIVSIGFEGVQNAKTDIQNIIRSKLTAKSDQMATLIKHQQIGDADDKPETLESRKEVAKARTELANDVFDEIFGDDGDTLRTRFGDDGVKHLQEMGKIILENELSAGRTPDEANGRVQSFFQNVIFLRGINPHITIAVPDGDQSEVNKNIKTASIGISKTFQTIANDSVDDRSKVNPELADAYKKTGLADKIDALYKGLGMPQADKDGNILEGEGLGLDNRSFASQMGKILSDPTVTSSTTDPTTLKKEVADEIDRLLSEIDGDDSGSVDGSDTSVTQTTAPTTDPTTLKKEVADEIDRLMREIETDDSDESVSDVSGEDGPTSSTESSASDQIKENQQTIAQIRDVAKSENRELSPTERNIIRNLELANINLGNEAVDLN